MESELLQLIFVFALGAVCGAIAMLLWNKLSSGSASPNGIKQEYQDYQEKVEAHFEETSRKFQDMTQQYQDLYTHLSLGATSLCLPESVAANLVDESSSTIGIEQKTEQASGTDVPQKAAQDPMSSADGSNEVNESSSHSEENSVDKA